MKGLKTEDKLETTKSDKSWNELETTNSVQQFDLEEPDLLEAKRMRRQ